MEISDQTTSLDPYFASFEDSLSAKNYKPDTLANYRYLLRRFGRLLETEGIAPSALTPELAVELGRRLPVTPKSQIKVPNLARLFVAHLIEIGVATRPPLTPAQAERAELLSNFETYLLQQRGLSPRTIYHVLRFADRFLDHRFGDNMLDLPAMNIRDVVAFMEHLLARKHPFRDKTPATHLRSFFQYLFAQGLTTTNLSLSVPRTHKPWGARLPRHLSPDEVEAVLASVRVNPRRGARDYPRSPRPSYADQVLGFYQDAGLEPNIALEAKELQTALGLVASGGGICVVPASVRRLGRDDVRYIDLDEPKMTSPIIMSFRRNDTSVLLQKLIELVREFAPHEKFPSPSEDKG